MLTYNWQHYHYATMLATFIRIKDSSKVMPLATFNLICFMSLYSHLSHHTHTHDNSTPFPSCPFFSSAHTFVCVGASATIAAAAARVGVIVGKKGHERWLSDKRRVKVLSHCELEGTFGTWMYFVIYLLLPFNIIRLFSSFLLRFSLSCGCEKFGEFFSSSLTVVQIIVIKSMRKWGQLWCSIHSMWIQ